MVDMKLGALGLGDGNRASSPPRDTKATRQEYPMDRLDHVLDELVEQ
jgi:hypothetical protein